MQNETNYQEFLIQITTNTPLQDILDISTVAPVAGGVASVILGVSVLESKKAEAEALFNQELLSLQVVIKHTFTPDKIALTKIFGHTDQVSLHEKAHLTQDLDTQILSLLKDNQDITVPKLLWYNQEKRLTVMTDFRPEEFVLMQSLLIEDTLPQASAQQWGKTLAALVAFFKEQTPHLVQVEDSLTQARERLEELYGFLRIDLDLYREIENKFISGEYLIDPDVHPKNIAVKQNGECIVFDFGRCIKADIQHVPATFSAHIALAIVGGCFADIDAGIAYLKECISTYNTEVSEEDKIDELWFVRYFTAELIHRGMSGRWLDPNLFNNSSLQETEKAVHEIGIEVFRPEHEATIDTIDEVLELVKSVAEKVQQGKYKFRR